MSKKTKIGILGRGSWGNTLAFLLGQEKEVIIWSRNEAEVRRINKTRRFKKPSTLIYPDKVTITSNLEDLFDCEIIISAISVKGIEDVFGKLKELKIPEKIIIVNGSKGVEPNTLKTPCQLIGSILPNNPVAVVSGPNLAKEVIAGKPMVTEVACKDIDIAKQIQGAIQCPTLRVYTDTDVIGVELAGALKNIIAIAAGCCDGLELGVSAKSSLITRGIAEIGKFLAFYGGKTETLLGASGVGDLVATASSDLSRNYRVGYNLAKGKNLNHIIETLGEVAEGINTTYAVYRICQENNLQMPIVEQVKAVLDNNITPVDALLNLMNRPIGEDES